MMNIITQIIFCMVAASLLGFVIGWIFSSLLRNEKHQNQILAVKEKFDEQQAQITLLETKIDTKNREILTVREQYSVLQNEMTNTQDDNKDNSILHTKITDLEGENIVLLEQIKEQKICDDEKDILENELRELENEKNKLILRVEELKEFEISYKDNIHRIAELESNQNRDQTDLKPQKKSVKKTKKKKEKKDIIPHKLNDEICKDKSIITDKDIVSQGNEQDKISQIIKNLFSNTKD